MSETLARVMPYAVDLGKTIKKTYMDTLFATDDSEAHRFDIILYRDNAKLTIPSGATVSAYFIRYCDDVTIPLSGSADGNVVSVTLSKSCYNKAGQFALIIKANTGSEISTVFYGEGAIFTSSTDTILDDEHIIPSLAELLAQIDAMEAATKAANTATGNANTATTNANTAAGKANTAADNANTAANSANAAANAANTAAENWDSSYAADSAKLGGKSPSEYASATELSALKSDMRVNLIRPTMQTMETNGVTCTNNGDGTYTLNGTASGSTNFYILDQVKDLGGKRIVGCPSGGGYDSYRLYAIRTDTYADSMNDFGKGVYVSTEFSKDIAWQIRIRIQDGVTVNNLVFKPMITDDLTAAYDDFVSYDDSFVKGRDVIAKESIGDAWVSGKTYSVGDYAISGNRLYKCKTAHTAGSAFSADYWETVSVAGEVQSALSGISELNGVRMYAFDVPGSKSSVDNTVTFDLSTLKAGTYMVCLAGGHIDGSNYSLLMFGHCTVTSSKNYIGFSLHEIYMSGQYTVTWSKPSGLNQTNLTIKAYSNADGISANSKLIFIGK